jgi:hypothetical protein
MQVKWAAQQFMVEEGAYHGFMKARLERNAAKAGEQDQDATLGDSRVGEGVGDAEQAATLPTI